MNYDLLIKNGIVVTEQKIIDADVYVKDGIIAKILIRDGSLRLEECTEATTVIDAEGNYVFPGFIDPHVHFNDPGLTNSEDFYTGTCAAAAGGITTVFLCRTISETLRKNAGLQAAKPSLISAYSELALMTMRKKWKKLSEAVQWLSKHFFLIHRRYPGLTMGRFWTG